MILCVREFDKSCKTVLDTCLSNVLTSYSRHKSRSPGSGSASHTRSKVPQAWHVKWRNMLRRLGYNCESVLCFDYDACKQRSSYGDFIKLRVLVQGP